MAHSSRATAIIAAFTACTLLPLAGCQATRFAKKGKEYRQAILAIYTEQAFDNLVRARNYQPFVQLKYREFFVQGTDSVSGSTDFSYTDVVAGAITRVVGFGAGGGRVVQLSFKAEPITDQNDIYHKYRDFAHNPYLFQVTGDPPECRCQFAAEYQGRYYWIPPEAEPAFQDLVMSTAFVRGEEKIEAAYERHIVAVTNVSPVAREEGFFNATIKLDETVPRGAATVIAVLQDGRKVRLVLDVEEGQGIREGEPTDKFDIQFSPKMDHFTELNLVGAKARIYSHFYPPGLPAIDPAPQRILDSLDQIRANQFLGNPL